VASLITHVSRKQMGYRFLETFQISVQTITMVLGYGATIGEKRHPRFSISFQNTVSCQDKLRVNAGEILGVSRSNRGVQCKRDVNLRSEVAKMNEIQSALVYCCLSLPARRFHLLPPRAVL